MPDLDIPRSSDPALVQVDVTAQALVDHLRVQYAERVAALETIEVTVPEDPVALGLSNFNRLISQLRVHSNNGSVLLNALTREKALARDRFLRAKTAYESLLNHLLSSDEEIQSIAGQQAKKALAQEKAQRAALVVSWADRVQALVQSYYDATKLAMDRFKDTRRDLQAQLDVVRSQIALGEVSHEQFPVGSRPDRPQNKIQAAERAIKEELGDLPTGSVEF